MTKRSKYEREQRDAANVRAKQFTADWERALSPEQAAAFAAKVEAARVRGPLPPRPDMAPGTPPNPPRKEPRPAKKEEPRRTRY